MAESRVKKTLLNARVNLIFYFLTLALSFFSRKIFLDCLGADFIGLTGTLQNLLGFLNLAELGIGSAIGYVLYKPLFNHDQEKINEIISVMGYLYSWIGIIILGAGCILSCFLPFIFPNTQFKLSLIYFAYFSFLASSLIGYFINYRQTLLGADQRNYVVAAYFQTANIIKVLIQMISAYYTGSYFMWVFIELTFGIIYSFILNWKINKTYPWLRSKIKIGRQLFKHYPEVIKYTRQLFVHRISAFVQFQISPMLIYAFVSLHVVAFYGNYSMLFDKITQFFNNLLGSAGASVGNLIAEGNKEKIIRVYWEIMSIRFLISGIVITSFFSLFEPFITIWLGPQYLLNRTILILLLINFFIGMSRGSDSFLYGYGLFSDTWAPVAESLIFIGVSLVGGFYYGLIGIVMATTISTAIIIAIWKPYFLFKKGFQIKLRSYWIQWIKYLTTIIINTLTVNYVFTNWLGKITGWTSFIIQALIIGILALIMYNIVFIICFKSYRSCLRNYLFKKLTIKV